MSRSKRIVATVEQRFRILAVPLSLPVPHTHRNELDSARWNSRGSSAGAAELPKMRGPSTADNAAIAVAGRVSLIHPEGTEKSEGGPKHKTRYIS